MVRVSSFAFSGNCQVSARSCGEVLSRYCERMTKEKVSVREKQKLHQRHLKFKFVYGTKEMPR